MAQSAPPLRSVDEQAALELLGRRRQRRRDAPRRRERRAQKPLESVPLRRVDEPQRALLDALDKILADSLAAGACSSSSVFVK